MQDKIKSLGEGIEIEIWVQDEMRVGQKNSRVRQWAPTGTRPRQPADQRFESMYVFGAFCPQKGTAAAILSPVCNHKIMQMHLDEISQQVGGKAHAMIILDGAGWHSAIELVIPENITLAILPPYSPELNPSENIWQYMRQNWISNTVFDDLEEIFRIVEDAWNKLLNLPERITSITSRKWLCVDA